MAKRARQGGMTWGTIALIVVGLAFLAWWLSARRAETPGLPASIPGARALSEAPDGHPQEEITGDEKADLQRVIQERSQATPKR
jgi:hypothetical protein